MCFHSKQSKSAQTLEKRFKASLETVDCFAPTHHYNGFTFPKTPVITHENTSMIQMINWGLLPHWAEKNFNKSHTLNARLETLHEKPSFRKIVDNRCVIIVDGFYEWQQRGKEKLKYEIGFKDELFALAGLFDINEGYKSYTIVTTEAQGIMREIHNTNHRMPIALKTDKEIEQWMQGNPVEPRYDFSATPLAPIQGSLFGS